MFTKIPLVPDSLPRSNVSVIGDTNYSHTMSLLSRTLRARNPVITAPPVNSIIWQNIGGGKQIEEIGAFLKHLLNNPFFLRASSGAKEGIPLDGAVQPWLVAIASLGVSGMLNFPRIHLNDLPDSAVFLDILEKEEFDPPVKMTAEEVDLDHIMEEDPKREPFARLILTMAYEAMIKSGLFTKIAPPENTAEREQFLRVERILLLRTMLQIVSMQTTLLRVRPILRYLRTDQARIRLSEDFEPSRLEYWESLIDRVLALPVHPWIAMAEGPSVPTARRTPWGASTPTILLDRIFFRDIWDGKGNRTAQEIAAEAMKLQARIDPVRLLQKLGDMLKAFRRLLDEIDESGRAQKIYTLLGFTTTVSPVRIPLWDVDVMPFYSDGLNSTAAVADLIEASYQPHFPAQSGRGSPWIGENDIILYYGADRIDGKGNVWSEYTATINVSPEDVLAADGFFAGRISPKGLLYKDESYLGDLDAVQLPSELGSIAALFGRSKGEIIAEIHAHPAEWAHIAVPTDSGRPSAQGGPSVTFKKEGATLFFSERTQTPWLVPVKLPRIGVPSVMWTLVRGRADVAMATMAQFVRDRLIPVATVPLTGAVSTLVTKAVSAQLTGLTRGPGIG